MAEWSVSAEKMLEVLSVIELVPTRPGVPASVFMQMTENNGRMKVALSSEVSGVVSLPGQGSLGLKRSMFLDRRILCPFLMAAKDYRSEKPFVFKNGQENKQILVSQGRRKAYFDLVGEVSGYGNLKADGGVVLPLSTALTGLIKVAAECGTADPSVPELNCVYSIFDGKRVRLYGSNQLVALRGVEKVKGKFPVKLALPLFVIPFLGLDGLKEARVKDTEVILQFSCGVIWQGVPVKAQKSFPYKNIDKGLEDGLSWPIQFRMQTRKLGFITSRFTQYLTAVRRQDWLMKLIAKSGEKQILMEVKIPQGVFHEWLAVEDAIEKDFTIDWPLDIMLPVLEYLHKEKERVVKVHFGKDTPYLLDAGNVQLLVARRKK